MSEYEEMTGDEEIPLTPKENGGGKESLFVSKIQPCLAEFVGSTLFIFLGIMTVRTTDNIVAPALGHGLALAALVLAFGNMSGAHFNPAVTVGVLISGGVSLILAPMYIGCQLMGSILAALLARGCLTYFPVPFPTGGPNQTVYQAIGGGAPTLAPGMTYGAGLLTEMTLTFILVTVILMIAVDTDSSGVLAPIGIGMTLAAAIFAGGPSTGASLNPARTFGPAVVVSDIKPDVWSDHWIYWVGPLLGAVLAGGLYRFMLAARDKRVLFKED